MFYLIALVCLGLLQGNLVIAAGGKEKKITLVNEFPSSFNYTIESKRIQIASGSINENATKHITIPEQQTAVDIQITDNDGEQTSAAIRKNQHKVTIKPVVHVVLAVE